MITWLIHKLGGVTKEELLLPLEDLRARMEIQCGKDWRADIYDYVNLVIDTCSDK